MERQTWHNGEYWTQVQSRDVGYKSICTKLAAYEDTGLEPEEIPSGFELANVYAAMQLLKQYQSVGAIEEFRALKEAEQEGRLVVLPCKVGEFVFVSPNNGKSFHKAKLYGKNEEGSHLVRLCDDLLTDDEKHIVKAPLSRIFYDWFFTIYSRKEAEAALDGGVLSD